MDELSKAQQQLCSWFTTRVRCAPFVYVFHLHFQYLLWSREINSNLSIFSENHRWASFVQLMKFGINEPSNSMQSKMRVSYTRCHITRIHKVWHGMLQSIVLLSVSIPSLFAHKLNVFDSLFPPPTPLRWHHVGYQQFVSYSKPFSIPERRQQRGSSRCCWLSISAFSPSWSIQEYYNNQCK